MYDFQPCPAYLPPAESGCTPHQIPAPTLFQQIKQAKDKILSIGTELLEGFIASLLQVPIHDSTFQSQMSTWEKL